MRIKSASTPPPPKKKKGEKKKKKEKKKRRRRKKKEKWAARRRECDGAAGARGSSSSSSTAGMGRCGREGGREDAPGGEPRPSASDRSTAIELRGSSVQDQWSMGSLCGLV